MATPIRFTGEVRQSGWSKSVASHHNLTTGSGNHSKATQCQRYPCLKGNGETRAGEMRLMAQTIRVAVLEMTSDVAVFVAALGVSAAIGADRSDPSASALPHARLPIPQSFAGGRGESWTWAPPLVP